MKILFLTTAHNSLSQRLYLELESTGKYSLSIEYAISEEIMLSAVELFQPDLIICPFLTRRVPEKIYDSVMTLIVHPGPPGDAGPSSLDWLLMGDNGSEADAAKQLKKLDVESDQESFPRKHWGVSIIQATEKFDAGPVWAFERFPIDIDEPFLTKSSLYRGPITRAAIRSTIKAIDRLVTAKMGKYHSEFLADETSGLKTKIEPNLVVDDWSVILDGNGEFAFSVSVGDNTRERPLLKAADREFDVHRHTAKQISRRIRCADSQPGVQSRIFGPAVYVYGGIIDDLVGLDSEVLAASPGDVIMTKNEAVCIKTYDHKGIWITHIRRLKRKGDSALWPKVPAVFGLLELGILDEEKVGKLNRKVHLDEGRRWDLSENRTFQEVWVDRDESCGIAYIHFEFYNGAMSTRQCKLLLDAIRDALLMSCSDGKDKTRPICALVLMGGSYFSNGIALNVIEASSDPAQESWNNINAMDDVVQYLLEISRDRDILTVAGVRGNAAAGGVALMAACDYAICGTEVVLNPAYRGIGLYGSEFHTLSYYGRCGSQRAEALLNDMLPLSPQDAMFLVDEVFHGRGDELNNHISEKARELVRSRAKFGSFEALGKLPGLPFWTQHNDLSHERLKEAREKELGEMKMDFWSPRNERYNKRRFNFVRKVKPQRTPLRFAKHRREDGMLDEEERKDFDALPYWEVMNRQSAQDKPEVEVVTEEVGNLVVEEGKVNPELFGCYYNS